MIVRGEIAQPRRETVRQAHRPEQGRRTGARSLEEQRPTRAVGRGFEGRARWPQACRNSGSAIATEES